MTTTPETVIVNTPYPTTKEQLISAGIAIGTATAVTLVTFGSLAAIGFVSGKVEDRRLAKEAKKETKAVKAS